jgi:hypothetical protein
MSSDFQCSECAAWVNIPRVLKTVTCRRCGEVYFCNDGEPRKMYPALSMHPMSALRVQELTGVLSKWMPTHTRPLIVGCYECRFRTTEPNVIQLLWNGTRFVVPSTSERVQMQHFLTWRGVLA